MFEPTDYAGLDYSGPGSTANRFHGTDVRYGALSQREVNPDIEPEHDYGDPSCPKCGQKVNDLSESEFDFFAECGVWQCQECERVSYPMELQYDDEDKPRCPECANECIEVKFVRYHEHQCDEYVCVHCLTTYGAEVCYPDEPLSMTLEEGHTKAVDCLDSDWLVVDSPFITRSQFCSPCVPGAGNLHSPCETGPVCLCFGHHFFDDEKAPYPVCLLQPWLDNQEIVMVLPDGETRQYENWETVFAVWQMRKGQ